MDRESKKRRQNRKVILTELIMVLTVVVLVAFLTLIVMGYQWSKEGGLEQSGLLQITSHPSWPTVEIDGDELPPRLSINKMLPEGEHDIVVSKEGYDTWQKKVQIKSGWLTKLDYVWLFKNDRVKEKVRDLDSLEFFSTSVDQTKLLYAAQDATVWNIMNIASDEVEVKTIDMADLLKSSDEENIEVMAGEVRNLVWYGKFVVVEYWHNEQRQWIIIDTENTTASLNITREFGLDFVKIRPSDVGQFLVLENQNLREITLASKEITDVIKSQIIDFYNSDVTVFYLTAPTEEGVRQVRSMRLGESTTIKLKTIKESEKVVKLAISQYLNESYFGLIIGQDFYIYKGQFPTNAKEKSLKQLLKQKIDILTDTLEVRSDGRFLVARSMGQLAVFDAETAVIDQFNTGATEVFWLNDFLVANIAGGSLVERDFDGDNERVLLEKNTTQKAVISVNNHWLYYVSEKDGKIQLMRERL